MRVNLKLARLLLNLSVIATGLVYFLRGMSPRLPLIPMLAAIVIVNVAFSWAQRSRRNQALPGTAGSGAKEAERSDAHAKPGGLKARVLFLVGLVCGSGLGICYAHETKHWLFIPAGAFVGYALGQALLKKYR
jgi:uncharacterized membrane protein